MEKASEQEQLESALGNAVRLHGHLGPFLTIGVRMGNLAKRLLRHNAETNATYHLTMRVPLVVPFSCAIDGIQVTTNCTIGNQKLAVENSQKEICADFRVKDSNRALNISVNPKVISDLMKKMAEGATSEELAEQIASMAEKLLFTIREQ